MSLDAQPRPTRDPAGAVPPLVRPAVGGLELLRATYVTHTFAPHTHEGFALGVIEAGAQVFCYRGARHVAPAGCLVAINPGELHTGEAVQGG